MTAPVEMGAIELDVTGMTCAACASRIERALNRLDGVTAAVNYATERASVTFEPSASAPAANDSETAATSADRSSPAGVASVIGTVESLGYGAMLHERPDASAVATDADGDEWPSASPADVAAEARARDLRQRLFVSLVLAVPVALLSMIPALQFRNWQWLAFTLTAPVVVWGAWPFHRATLKNARHGTATMDTLVSLGVVAAFGWSTWALFVGDAGMPGATMRMSWFPARAGGHHGARFSELYLEVAVTLVVFMLAGRYFETRAKRRSSAALRALLDVGAKHATVLRVGRETTVPTAQLRVGELIVVRPGEKLAADGVVVEGASALDESMLTGESVPVDVMVDSNVTGGTLNLGGRVVVRTTRVGRDTTLAQMARLVEAAQSGKAQVQRLADRVSAVFVPLVIVLAIGTLIGWLAITGDVDRAFTAAVAVLIIACPCALGLATPTALLVGTGRGAQLGLLIKGPEILESTRQVDTVVLDKTGTVTTGRMEVIDAAVSAGTDRDEALWLAGSLESASEHPVARAIVRHVEGAIARPITPPITFANQPGLGVRGDVDGRSIVAGRPRFVIELVGSLPAALAEFVEHHEQQGQTVIVAACDGVAQVAIAVADVVKPTSREAVQRLRQLGLRTLLVTGDNAATAQAVAAEVGIDAGDVIAEVLPADKVAAVEELQRSGATVAMVGDGVNDAAALARADIGIAIGTGTDAAIEASDLTIISGDLRGAADALRLSRRTLSTIKGNLFWAFAYNVAALPLAAAGYMNPVLAGLAMAMSSVFVLSNSLRLRRFH